ncbi:hypothetical protein H0H92_004484 [Tricholoma furcatifolium]|nr:hypothetical protein H0H92_004484 [Tricholoma furcatifolium]
MLLARQQGWRSFPRVFGPVFQARLFSGQTNPPLNLDPTFRAVLDEGDMSLLKGKAGKRVKELEVVSFKKFDAVELDDDLYGMERKSPAAEFGSRQIGAVILPNQLQNAINALISKSDKTQLHSDAKRLFSDESQGITEWAPHYDPKDYSSRKKASRHSDRDGTAFASVVLPAHYSSILAVFEQIKQRLEPSWRAKRVIDWGAGTGSGLWAALHAFQSSQKAIRTEDKTVTDSSINNYTGIDKREGLVAVGKRLLEDLELGHLNLSWQKTFKEQDRLKPAEGHETIALSSFMLSSLRTGELRKALVQDMWESGAHIMVLIDHNTTEGFEAIAQARQVLLRMGRKELEDVEVENSKTLKDVAAHSSLIRGSHVVAPCPHDGVCPLYHSASSRLVCGFSQRLQRPSFVRKTKHSGVGHEDIEYSYVVIRRGPRPTPVLTNVGRVGEVGKRASEKEALQQTPIKELKLDSEHATNDESVAEDTFPAVTDSLIPEIQEELSPEELEEALRLESYTWPRLVFPPLKKSGHIILDGCTAEGKIMRLTIPKSQGKQPFYDARKSSWGDSFPHAPKNAPQERFEPTRAKRQDANVKGSDIGKRKRAKKDTISYEAVSKDIKGHRRNSRVDRP